MVVFRMNTHLQISTFDTSTTNYSIRGVQRHPQATAMQNASHKFFGGLLGTKMRKLGRVQSLPF